MSTDLPTDAEAFSDFLNQQIATGGRDLSPEELLKVWRTEHAEATEDIRQGIKNMEAGRGIPFGEVDLRIREEFGFSKKDT